MRPVLIASIAIWIFVDPSLKSGFASDAAIGRHDVESKSILTSEAANDLFSSLDLGRPELAAVAVAWRRGDRDLAERELAKYFRTRSKIGWRNDVSENRSLSPQGREIAEDAVRGRLQGGSVPPVYLFPNELIDWHWNATDHIPQTSHNDEWQWQLNRMSFWTDLASAYRSTGDERYAQAFVQELRSWILQCPVPSDANNAPGSAWRTIEAGIRSGGSWMDAFYAFRDSPSLDDDDVLALVHSFLDHGRYLRNFHTKLNWLTMEMSGLYTVGTEFPEFRDSANWRSFAITALAEESHKQFLPDGAQIELSSGYQNVALDNFLHISDVARWAGKANELPPDFVAPLKRGYEWQVGIVAPDRYLPKINDSWQTYLPSILKRATLHFPNQAEFQWFASNGYQGLSPAYTSIFLARSGFAAMRTNWDSNANYLLFRVGPLGMGHQHQDSLGINVWAYGRELVFNGGGGSYEKSKWRQWAISAFAHNTVVVDGMAQTRPVDQKDPFHDPNEVSQGPIDAHWKTNAVYDFAAGEYDEGYGPSHKRIVHQRRDVLFLKPNLFIVADRLDPHDRLSHQYQARWQLLTTQTKNDPATQSVITDDPGVPNIAIVPLLKDDLRTNTASGQEEPEILGWNVRKDIAPARVPATTVLQTMSGSGTRLLLTMLVPLRAGEANPVRSVESGTDSVSATVLFADGRKILVSCPGPAGIFLRETLPNSKEGRLVDSNK